MDIMSHHERHLKDSGKEVGTKDDIRETVSQVIQDILSQVSFEESLEILTSNDLSLKGLPSNLSDDLLSSSSSSSNESKGKNDLKTDSDLSLLLLDPETSLLTSSLTHDRKVLGHQTQHQAKEQMIPDRPSVVSRDFSCPSSSSRNNREEEAGGGDAMKETSLEATQRVASALFWKDMEDIEGEKSHEEQEEASASRLLVDQEKKESIARNKDRDEGNEGRNEGIVFEGDEKNLFDHKKRKKREEVENREGIKKKRPKQEEKSNEEQQEMAEKQEEVREEVKGEEEGDSKNVQEKQEENEEYDVHESVSGRRQLSMKLSRRKEDNPSSQESSSPSTSSLKDMTDTGRNKRYQEILQDLSPSNLFLPSSAAKKTHSLFSPIIKKDITDKTDEGEQEEEQEEDMRRQPEENQGDNHSNRDHHQEKVTEVVLSTRKDTPNETDMNPVSDQSLREETNQKGLEDTPGKETGIHYLRDTIYSFLQLTKKREGEVTLCQKRRRDIQPQNEVKGDADEGGEDKKKKMRDTNDSAKEAGIRKESQSFMSADEETDTKGSKENRMSDSRGELSSSGQEDEDEKRPQKEEDTDNLLQEEQEEVVKQDSFQIRGDNTREEGVEDETRKTLVNFIPTTNETVDEELKEETKDKEKNESEVGAEEDCDREADKIFQENAFNLSQDKNQRKKKRQGNLWKEDGGGDTALSVKNNKRVRIKIPEEDLSHEAQLMTEANFNPGIEFTLSSSSASDSTAKSSQSKESDNEEEDEKEDNDNKENENPDEDDSEEVEAGTKHVRRRFAGPSPRYLSNPWLPQYSPFIQTQLHSDPSRVRTGLSRNFKPKNPLHPNLYNNLDT